MFLDKFKKFLVANFRLFSLIIPLIILGCGYLYFLRPKYNYLKMTGGLTLNILKSSLQSKKEYLKNLEELKITYNNLTEEEKEKLEQILPLKKDIPNLFVHFENLIKQNGLKLSSINFTEEDTTEEDIKKGVKILNIDLGLKGGNYQILKKFLTNLEQDIKIMDVVSISFSPEGYNIKLKTYYLSE